jgi:hypothetical protein
MDSAVVADLGRKMIVFLETGDAPEGLFHPDVFLDLTLPTWRVQARGREDLIRVRKAGHPCPGRVTRCRIDPTETGFVLEFEERWRHGGQHWYARELSRMDVVDGGIADLTVYCTGDWDEARQREHRGAITLLRP